MSAKEFLGWSLITIAVVGGFLRWYTGYEADRRAECVAKGGERHEAGGSHLCLTSDGRVIP